RDWRRPPQHRAAQRTAVAAVGGVLGGDRPLRHGELASRRADARHAAVAAACGVLAGRPAVAGRRLAALCGRHTVAAGRRARVLVGMAGPRPAGLARPGKRDTGGADPEAGAVIRRLREVRSMARPGVLAVLFCVRPGAARRAFGAGAGVTSWPGAPCRFTS